jgi:hypothetical protein
MCEFSVLSFGCFPGVWFILADVSEHSICSIFKADDLEVKHPEDSTLNTKHGESLKSRRCVKLLHSKPPTHFGHPVGPSSWRSLTNRIY